MKTIVSGLLFLNWSVISSFHNNITGLNFPISRIWLAQTAYIIDNNARESFSLRKKCDFISLNIHGVRTCQTVLKWLMNNTILRVFFYQLITQVMSGEYQSVISHGSQIMSFSLNMFFLYMDMWNVHDKNVVIYCYMYIMYNVKIDDDIKSKMNYSVQ